MFDKSFEQLFSALKRIENQLTVADHDQKEILREELIALRSVGDRFVEKWLAFEEKVADLSEFFDLEIDLDSIPGMAGEEPSFKDWTVPIKLSPLPEDGEQILQSFRKGLGFFDLLMFPDAIRELEQVVQIDGDFAVARLYLALGYLGKKEYQKAIQQLNLVAVGQSDPMILSTIHNTYGHIYAAQADYKKAAKEFKSATLYTKDYQDAYFNLGVCHLNLQEYEAALSAFLKSIELEDQDWEAECLVSLVWQKLGNLQRAFTHIERAYQSNSSDFRILIQYAGLSQHFGKIDLARSLYNRAKRFYPNKIEPLGGLGWLDLQNGNSLSAIASFKKQLSLDPHNRQALFNYGWVMLMEGDLQKAEWIFSQLARLYPDYDLVQVGLAKIHQIQNRPVQANHILERVIESANPHSRKIGHLQFGKMALERGDFVRAVDQLSKALQIDSSSKEIWYYKGLAHEGLGEDDEARKCWNYCKI